MPHSANIEQSAQNKIHSIFLNAINTPSKRKIQNLVINHQSENLYNFFIEKTLECADVYKEIGTYINWLIDKYQPFLDLEKENFLKHLRKNFFAHIFELVMAELFSKGFPLMPHSKKDGSADLYTPDYFIECVTRNTGFVQDWYDDIQNFQKKYEILHFLIQDNNKDKNPLRSLSNKLLLMSDSELTTISNILGCNIGEIERTLAKWIQLNEYMHTWNKTLIPEEFLKNIILLGIPRMTPRNIDYKFILRETLKCLLDKLKQIYFQGDLKGVVCISIGSILDGLHFSADETRNFMLYFQKNYQRVMDKLRKSDFLRHDALITKGLSNLSCIIIDTNWYNWFGEILERHGLANFENKHKNLFVTIHNQSVQQDSALRNYLDANLRFTYELPFI